MNARTWERTWAPFLSQLAESAASHHTDNDASLSDRACACVEGTCANCGFAAVWTNGVRKSLLSGVLLEGGIEALREDIDEVWCEKLTWCR